MPDCTCGGLRVIGDVHGAADALWDAHAGHANAIQIGDMGLGFSMDDYLRDVLEEKGIRFFRGNHDEPTTCQAHPRHLASGWHAKDSLFVIGGGYSIDRAYRTAGRNWWPDEEHSEPEMRALVEEFADTKPRLVLSHEAPDSVTDAMFNPTPKMVSRTATALQAMYAAHQPDLWLFGHWHRGREMKQGNTLFVCVGEKKTRDIHLPTCPLFEQSATPSAARIAARLAAMKEN